MVFRNRRSDLGNAAKRTNDAGSELVFDEPASDTVGMVTYMKSLLFSLTLLFSGIGLFQTARPTTAPQFTSAGEMRLPENYRQWVYLTTGFDMSYNPAMQMGHHMFDNVFVNPEAYDAFINTGKWPDKTTFILEARRGLDKGSINQAGSYQSEEIMAIEVHVKDESRLAGKWAFFAFDDGKTAKMIPTSADCYSCHATHGAVDTTFVQFYPTLLPVARSKGTLSPQYKGDDRH
jgi:hypothetical protein